MNLLIVELPLLILLTLAQQIGIDKSILQQQLHFSMTHQGQERNRMLWYYQTYTNWTRHVPFWNESKIICLFIKLEKDVLVKIKGQVQHIFCRSYKMVFKLSTVCSIHFSMPTQMKK